MNSPNGLSDLSQPLEADGCAVYPALGQPGSFLYVPGTLRLAQRHNPHETVDFSLELVRGTSPFLPPQPYGVLDFSLVPSRFSAAALAVLRQQHPHAVVAPLLFTRGYLRLQSLAGAGESSNDFAPPVPLAANGLETVRLVQRLSQEATNLLKQYLEGASLSFRAMAEMEALTVAPRLPGRVKFQVSALLVALERLADTQRRITRDAVLHFWMQSASSLPVQIEVTPLDLDPAHFAHAMADHTLANFARFVPAAGASIEPTFELQAPPETNQEAIWDLSQPKIVPKIFVLTLNPFEEARRVVEAQGVQAVLHETVVPPLDTGFETILVSANLPPAVQGVRLLGVHLVAPPRPPQRVHPLTASRRFNQPGEIHRIDWRFAPLEPVEFEYKTFVVPSTGSVEQIFGQPTRHTGNYLNLSVADFPLAFIPLSASELLLQEGTIQGICRYPQPESGAPTEIPFALTAVQPAVTLALPQAAAAQASLAMEAVSLEDGTRLPLGSFPARGTRLDLMSLAAYGPHTIDIEAVFDQALPLIAIDLLPQGKPETAEHLSTLALTPEKPMAQWSYFASSPFRAGYCYRQRGLDGTTGAWSTVRLPSERLVLIASQLH
jgi:hypothetical protein